MIYQKNDKKFYIRKNTCDKQTIDEIFRLNTYLNKLSLKKDDIVLDIGGNIGSSSVLFSDKVKQVIVFEPQIDNFRFLLKNIKLNRCENVIAFNKALINTDDKQIYFYENVLRNKGSHSILSIRGRKRVIAQAENIDNVVKKYMPTIIKCDCEGAEVRLISHKIDVRNMIIEYHHSMLHFNELEYENFKKMLNKKYRITCTRKSKKSWVSYISCIRR